MSAIKSKIFQVAAKWHNKALGEKLAQFGEKFLFLFFLPIHVKFIVFSKASNIKIYSVRATQRPCVWLFPVFLLKSKKPGIILNNFSLFSSSSNVSFLRLRRQWRGGDISMKRVLLTKEHQQENVFDV
jgi:hypothetical protein